MSFTVVDPHYDERHGDSVLRGVAHGLGQLFPLPDHPEGVCGPAASASPEDRADRQTVEDEPPHRGTCAQAR
ncbi:hypothetical protein [Methylobacterium sp. J-076]|uniref:hypothetical protein n=1 Tax=Methylobacterium sp. J-076 TaxID=2836655 RepID=UPI001FBA34FB|nr:hypothetical protein [Methylobacterium sp. J-076]MCJ2014742.1 hypothetical protein [Methylobacterium sp. J-076]